MTWLQGLWKATLVVVAVGVALMHSTGHACTDEACHTASSAAASAFESRAHSDGEAHDHPVGSGMNPMQVCMAILTGLALAVSLWAIRRLARMVGDGHQAARFHGTAFRLPSSRPPGGGPSFIELSVFRI